MGDAFDRLIQYLNKMMFRWLLVPSLVFDEDQKSGSYALGQSHFDIYQIMLDKVFIRPLVEMNYGPQDDYGEFPEREMNEDDMEKLAGVFLQLTNTGYMDFMTKEDAEYVRSKFGLPESRKPDKRKALAESYVAHLEWSEVQWVGG